MDGFHVDLITNYGDEDHYNYDKITGIGLGKSTANHERFGGVYRQILPKKTDPSIPKTNCWDRKKIKAGGMYGNVIGI